MTERREVYESLDLDLRIGEILLSSGAGAADVTTTMLEVTQACGVRNVSGRHVRRPYAAASAEKRRGRGPCRPAG